MPILLIGEGKQTRAVPLGPDTLIGRSSACLVRMHEAACPGVWLQLRWSGAGWAWRALAAGDRTIGRGAFQADGWRALDARDGRGARVSLAGVGVWVELVDGSPPVVFAWDVVLDLPVEGDALADVAEVRGDLLLPLSAEGDADRALADGEAWTHPMPDGSVRVLRAHLPHPSPATAVGRLDVARPGLLLEVHLPTLAATFLQDGASVEVRGECVRALAVFVSARLGGEGWLGAAAAWAMWGDMGGRRDTQLERLSSERGKLRAKLSGQHVASVADLFEHRKSGSYVSTRLSIPAENLRLDR